MSSFIPLSIGSNSKKLVILQVLLLLIFHVNYAQDPINFSILSSNDGLSSNSVNAILKDKYGLMWFATEDGLNKFDGSRFTVYRNRAGDTSSLQANEIIAIHEDNAGNLWAGTSGGSLSLYNRKLDAFSTFPAGNLSNQINNNVVLSLCSDFRGKLWVGSFSGINIVDPKTRAISKFLVSEGLPFTKTTTCIYQDSKNQMWVGTNNGLYLYNPAKNKLMLFLNNNSDTTSISGNDINSIVEDKKGRLWIATTSGLSMKWPEKNGFVNYVHKNGFSGSISKGEVNAVEVDETGNIWIGTQNGLDIFNPETGVFTNISHDRRLVQGLSGRSIRSIFNDNQGILWVGTIQGGINMYDKNLNLFNLVQSLPFDNEGLPSPMVTSFAEEKGGNIFVGTEYGGVSLFEPQKQRFTHFKIRSKMSVSDEKLVVLALKYTKNNQLLIGTYHDGLFILNPETGNYRQITVQEGLSSNHIFCLYEDHNSNIWVGFNGTGIMVFNPKFDVIARYNPNPIQAGEERLPLNGYIRDFLEDYEGNMWFATYGGGIARINRADRSFSIFNSQNSDLPFDKVVTLFQDSKRNLWAGTSGGGMAKFEKESQKFLGFSEKDGLGNNNVYKILEDEEGRLWVSTNQGLSCLNVSAKKFENYTYHNGLQRGRYARGAGIRATNGQLYFGGHQGFNYFHPTRLRKNTNIPKVIFTNLRVSNETVIPSEDGPIRENILVAREINLDFRQNFTISFVGLNFTAPDKNQYAYKLEGFDGEWNNIGNSNSASFTNLDPGTYTLRVKASNNDGLWNNDGKSIFIIVHPPFWRTNFAYGIYFFLVAGVLWYSRYKGIQRLKRKYQLRQERMRIEQERREAERIRELDQQKIKFLTNLSHEFRTPISLIMGPIDSLIKQDKSEGGSFGQLHMIKRNAKRLLNLVNQLLDFRKMEEQELVLQPEEGELVGFISEATDSFRDYAERKKIELVFDNRIHRFITQFDHDKLERILFNLLSNAFKFTHQGGRITVKVDRINGRSDHEKEWIEIKVCDTGIGIPSDKLQKIFANFYQEAPAKGILNQGTGIGLSITKEFVELQGGTIRVESQVDKGSSFIIELPFKELKTFEKIEADEQLIESEGAGFGTNAVMVQKSSGENETILVVEDNDDFRHYLKDGLSANYKVIEAANGKEGWQRALAEHPAMILSDISMPYMDGIELCRKLKADKRTGHIPVILLTALTGEQEQLKGLEIGASDYITKPFNFDLLNAKIRNLLNLNDSFKKTYSKQIKVLAADVAVESEDEKLMQEIMDYLEENLTDTQLSVEALSRHVGMSRSSLYSRLLELTGESPVEFIRSVKLNKAAVLLEKSDMNIAQIAYTVGFATPNYFAKSFKAKFNLLPSEYLAQRRSIRHYEKD